MKLFLICKALKLDIQFKGVINLKSYIYYYGIENYKMVDVVKEVFYEHDISDDDNQRLTQSILNPVFGDRDDYILLTTNDITMNGGEQFRDCDADCIDTAKEFLEDIKSSGAEYDKDITWITKPKRWLEGTTYTVFGNEPQTIYHYVSGAFVINFERSI